jgi:hypothetical protein
MLQPIARPFGVTVVAMLVALHGIVAFFQAVAALSLPGVGVTTFLLDALFALVLLYLAYSLWTVQPWAWLTTLLIEGINAFFALVTIVLAPASLGAWITILLAAGIFYYLSRPSVRAAFGNPRFRG